MRGARAGFTLIELLVVVAIIAILAGIAMPMFRHVIASSRSTACVSNLRQLGVALSAYLADHNNVMPALQAGRSAKSEDVPVIDNTLDRYAPDPKVFACPADDQNLAANTGTSYFWNSSLSEQHVSGLNFLGIQSLSRIPVLVDKSPFHPGAEDKVNLLYADGHASKDLTFITGN